MAAEIRAICLNFGFCLFEMLGTRSHTMNNPMRKILAIMALAFALPAAAHEFW